MKLPWILPTFAFSSLFLASCGMTRPVIESSGNSKLSNVSIGSLNKDAWTSLDLKMERLKPSSESIERSYQRSADGKGIDDVSVKAAYGTYKILLTYRNAQNEIIYESCPEEKAKEHVIDAPKYSSEIKVCEAGRTSPIDVVKPEDSEVSITPVGEAPAGGGGPAQGTEPEPVEGGKPVKGTEPEPVEGGKPAQDEVPQIEF